MSAENLFLKEQTKTTLYNIEFLRIMFTFGVLMCHFRGNVFKLVSGGGLAVEFFFILSGYLLAMTYKRERSILSIAARNWKRFVPLVVFAAAICGGGVSSLYGIGMLQYTGLAFISVPNNPPAWYIGVLFWCNLFYLGLYKSTNHHTRNLIIGCIVYISYLIISRTGADLYIVNEYIPHGMLRGLAGMGMGILLNNVVQRKPFYQCTSFAIRACYTVAELVLIFYIICGFFTSRLFIAYWIFNPIFYVILLSLFICKRGYISCLFEHRCWSQIAKYCLSIYLTHWFFVVNRFWIIPQSKTLSLIVAVVLSCIMGIVTHYLIEKVGVRVLDKFINAFKS